MSMRHNRLKNYIAPGLHSSLIGGGEHGKVRLFEAERMTRDLITPHSHRFSFTSLVLYGEVTNTIYEPSLPGAYDVEPFIRSTVTQVCGAGGLMEFKHTREAEPRHYRRRATTYKAGQTYLLRHDEVHSIVFEKNTKVLFFEMPQIQDWDWMLEPYVDGKLVPTFKTEPWMFGKE